MTNPMVFSSVTTSAKGNKIADSVISEFFFSGDAITIDVVNMEIIFTLAMLAGVIITYQSGLSIAAKDIVISSLAGVLFESFFIGRKPFMNFSYLVRALAIIASRLWARLINVIITAGSTHKDCANRGCSGSTSKPSKGSDVLHPSVFGFTCLADFLCGSRWFVFSITCRAYFYCVSRLGFAMSGKRTRFTSLGVWRKLSEGHVAIWAVDNSVYFHNNFNKKLDVSYCSIGDNNV